MVTKYHARNLSPAELKRTLEEFQKLHKDYPAEKQCIRIQFVLLKLNQLKGSDPEKFADEFEYYRVRLGKELKICQSKIRTNELNDIFFLSKVKNIKRKKDFILKAFSVFHEFKMELNKYNGSFNGKIDAKNAEKLRELMSNVAEQSLEWTPITWLGQSNREDDEVQIKLYEFSNLLWEVMQILVKLYNAFPISDIPLIPKNEKYSDNDHINNVIEMRLKKIVSDDAIPFEKEYVNFLENIPSSNMTFPDFMLKVNNIYNKIKTLKLSLDQISPALIFWQIFYTLEGMNTESLEECKYLYVYALDIMSNISHHCDELMVEINIPVCEDQPVITSSISINNSRHK